MTTIYLDNNATTPIDPHVADAIRQTSVQFTGNPASQHRTGQTARRRLELAKQNILKRLGAEPTGQRPHQLLLTSGGTEANNLALLGMADPKRPRILISAIEHPSVMGAAQQAKNLGFAMDLIPVDRHGVVRLDALEALLDRPTSLVSLMLANNETGVVQPVAAAAEICRRAGVKLHTDAVQAVGKMEVSFSQLGVDAMTFAPHKFHGPKSIGGLVVAADAAIHPLLHGGFQQGGLRPGTEDVALAVGCEVALERSQLELNTRRAFLAELRDAFLKTLAAQLDGDFVINGGQAERVPHTLNLSFPGVERQALLLAADSVGIAFSTGSACASGSSEPSSVLLAMGLGSSLVESAVRISFGMQNTLAEVTQAAAQIAEIVNCFRKN